MKTPAQNPRVSVIMGAFNAAETIGAAIESIIAQTYDDWELVVCNDGSTDGTAEVLHRYSQAHPDRIVVLASEMNRGLPASLNACISRARGELMARMDADDISRPERLAAQIAHLDAHPEIDIVGCGMQRFDADGLADVLIPPEKPDRGTMGRSLPFFHATIVARRSVYEQLGGYSLRRTAVRAEDVELWFRFFAAGLTGSNLPEPLYLVREDRNALLRRNAQTRINAYLTTIRGYRLLHSPAGAYLGATITLAKILVPKKLVMRYRAYQKRRYLGPTAQKC